MYSMLGYYHNVLYVLFCTAATGKSYNTLPASDRKPKKDKKKEKLKKTDIGQPSHFEFVLTLLYHIHGDPNKN